MFFVNSGLSLGCSYVSLPKYEENPSPRRKTALELCTFAAGKQ